MAGHKGQMFDVIRGQRRQLQITVGQVDTFVGAQLFARRSGLNYIDPYLILAHVDDYAADLAVVEPYFLARTDLRESFRERTANRGGCGRLALRVARRRDPGSQLARQD